MSEAGPFSVEVDSSGPWAGVGVLRLEQPGKPVVVLDHALIRRLEATLRAMPKGLIGLVLASASERVFVAGADLKAITELDDAALEKYLAYGSMVFGMLGQLPYPTAAAINGAVLGGGLELAMHCDGLIGAPGVKPYPVGLPEAGLSICPGWGGTNLLPARMDAVEAIRRTASGTPLMFDEAVAAGVFDAVAASHADLLPAAKAWVKARAASGRVERDGAPSRWIGRPAWAGRAVAGLDGVKDAIAATEPGRAVVAAVDAGLVRGWGAALAVERRELIRLRHTPAARAAIQAFFDRSTKK